MIFKKLILVFLFLAIAASLLNFNSFGSATLFAYFTYCIIVNSLSVILFIYLALQQKKNYALFSYSIISLFIFALYISLLAVIKKNLTLADYFWGSNIFLYISLWFYTQIAFTNSPQAHQQFLKHLFYSITVIASIESVIVLLQALQITKSNNELFICSGTWVNPNVTAMFLAFSFLPVIRIYAITLENNYFKKIVAAAIILILTAIVLLQCRTSYLIIFIFIVSHFLVICKGEGVLFFCKKVKIF